ncbi:MAG TPA: ROK family protein [Kiritimatiellia bacterium]|nr:ROK family protein [Kiritimatiellia bacterium]
MSRYLAIDLGGTKTAVCVGTADGTLIAHGRMPTDADAPPEGWLNRLSALVQEVAGQAGCAVADLESVGLAVPGPMSVKQGMVLEPPNMPAWRNVPIRDWVAELTRLPVHINNDANAAGLAEYSFGEFKGTPDLVYLTMSTGVGGGIISGGQLIQGANDLGGEVGHIVLNPDGPPCPCGQRGCFEMYCGGRNVIHQVRGRLAPGAASLILEESGGSADGITISAIARAAGRGDALAQEFWDAYVERLAQGIGLLAMCVNPSVVVLGTVAIHLGDVLLKPLRERLSRYAWRPAIASLTIRPSALGPQIGELGALAVALPRG